ncbi:LysE family translocator [Hwanghaeella grinnelliae]|uniref:LysE family translocator n=1 Tax=Hwanghaeella grinnelliae TaxID=2500179 RepID=A0A3S2VP84_9PROT|nr:LysE family translocator [Hwanghaeella grinnelliae]RVU36148.1 LysE family translocator [Hwanghaeella grinnelliae]
MAFWILFCASVVAVSVVPGPSTLIAFTHGARFGWCKALATAAGNAFASLLQASAASAGLGLLLTESASVLLATKYLGAAYLVYLGVRMWRSKADEIEAGAGTTAAPRVSGRLFRDGFLVAVSNPKAILFFTALFPQFLGTPGSESGRMVLMTVSVGVIAFMVAAVYAGLGARIRAMSVTQTAMRRLQRATGGLFVFAGIGLAASRA